MPKPLQRPIQFRAGELSDALRARADLREDEPTESADNIAALSQIARRDLDRYYALLARSLPAFSEGEASLLCDVGNGTLFEPHTMSLLWANVADALEDGYAEKWGVDGPALVARLRKLTQAEATAVVDAVERFWHGPYRQDAPMADRLRAVGLVRRGAP